MAKAVHTNAVGSTLVVTLNRPYARNAVDAEMAHALLAAMKHLDADRSLRAGIIQGAGSGFCAGMDLKEYRATGAAPSGLRQLLRSDNAKPLIAAIEGFALGAGLELALRCDLIVAAENAALCLPEVTLGLLAAGGGLIRLAHRLPYGDAMRMVLTGESVSGADAFSRGLVTHVTRDGHALETAIDTAKRIAANDQGAVVVSKRVLRASLGRTDEENWDLQDPYLQGFFGSRETLDEAGAVIRNRSAEA